MTCVTAPEVPLNFVPYLEDSSDVSEKKKDGGWKWEEIYEIDPWIDYVVCLLKIMITLSDIDNL